MAIIDPEGLFNGDRLRHCSNAAQLHWPRLFLASDGFARLEINYARIIGRAYPTFNPIPSETELNAWLKEYAENFLLFLYEVAGQLWAQWDTRAELLPRYKTACDRRSPIPPAAEFSEWKRRYREENKAFPKCFGKISAALQYGVGVGGGVGVGKNICASDDALPSVSLLSIEDLPFNTLEPDGLFDEEPSQSPGIESQQAAWFAQWWRAYWLKKDRKKAKAAFERHVRTEARFHQVMEATRAQSPEMLNREPKHRPYGATWLNGERWEDEPEGAGQAPSIYSPMEDDD